MPTMSASIYVTSGLIFLIILYFTYKRYHLGLGLVYVQGTTRRASDVHNARATIVNPFINLIISVSYTLVSARCNIQ